MRTVAAEHAPRAGFVLPFVVVTTALVAVLALAAQHGMQAPRNLAMCKLVAAHRKGVRLSGPDMRRTALP